MAAASGAGADMTPMMELAMARTETNEVLILMEAIKRYEGCKALEKSVADRKL